MHLWIVIKRAPVGFSIKGVLGNGPIDISQRIRTDSLEKLMGHTALKSRPQPVDRQRNGVGFSYIEEI